MTKMIKLMAAMVAPLVLTGCLFLPGKFDATLRLMEGGQYQFTYVGEMQIFAGDDKDMTPPKREPFDPEKAQCSDWIEDVGSKRPDSYYDRYASDATETIKPVASADAMDSSGTGPERVMRACTKEELATLQQQETDRYDRRKKEYDQRSGMMAGMFGGAVPGNDEALERFAATLRKYDGWDKVDYAGKNMFNVEYRASGNFDRYFAFPILNDASMQYPFFQIVPRKSGELEVMTPALGGSGSFLGMAMLDGMSFGNKKNAPIQPIEGSFTLITDGEVLANNSPDGYQSDDDTKTIVWNVKDLSDSPRALIKLQ